VKPKKWERAFVTEDATEAGDARLRNAAIVLVTVSVTEAVEARLKM